MAIDFEKIKKAAAAKDQAAQAAGLEAKTAYKPMVNGVALEQNHSGAAPVNTGGGVAGNALKGAAKSTASGWVNTGGTLLDLMSRASAKASSENRKANQQAENAAHYREMLASGKMADGTPMDAAKRAQLEMLVQRAERNAGIYREANESIHSHGAEAVQGLYKTADKLAAESGQHITAAKKDTGAVGDFLVDVGVAGTQLVGDALTGGLLATGIRAFGSGAQEARRSGATLGQQIGYGAGSAAVGVVAEKLANVAGPFKKAFGSGVLDKALAKVAAKPAGMLAISALSEGAEEGVEALVQPLLQKLTYNPDAAYDADWVADTLYSMVIGGVLGGAGGGIDVATSGRGQKIAPRRSGETQIAQNEGKVTPAQKEGAQGLSGDIMIAEARRLFGQNKTAPEMGAESNSVNNRKGTPTSAVNPANASSTYTSKTTEPEVPNANRSQTKVSLAGPVPTASSNESSPLSDSTIAESAKTVNVENMDPLLKMMMDGVGAANTGSLNSDYENLQAQSSSFHPEGANVAEGRHVDVPTQNFDGSNIPRGASNIMGGQALDEHDVRFLEQQIADGKLAFDTITDEDSVSWAQTTMAEKGFDGALEQYRQAVNSGVATKDNTTLGQQLLLAAMREGNVRYTAELLSLYTRNSTNAAQALQAQSIFRKLSPEGQLVAMQKAVDALNEKYGTTVEIDEADVADFMEAKTDEARQEVEKRIVKKAAKAVPGTFKAKFDTIRYLAMLGNPRTHVRNILGNTLFQVPVAVKNRVGAAAEIAASAVSRGKTERTKSLFGVNPFGKLAAEARADWGNVKDFLSQNSAYAEGKASLSAIEQEAHAFSDNNLLGRGVNALADANSKALEAEDMAAKRLIYTQSLAGYLKANGCKSIADADPALLNKARAYAADEALRNTFNDTNAVSAAVGKLGAAQKSDNKAIRAAGYVVEGALPFKKTPANIMVRAAEYSPVGAALGTLDTIRGARGGDMEAVSRGLDRLAAGLTGTGLMALGALAAGNGWVTGKEDEDEEQAGFDDLTGHQAYALELKDGTSVTLDWLAPEAIPFFMGVELYNAALDGGLSVSEMGDMLKNATAPMLELSMLQGLNDIFDNAAYAKYSGGSVMGSIVTSALTNYVTQVFPTIGGQLERSGEDVRMTTYTEKDGELPTDLQYTLGKVSQKIPGFDFQQIPYIDAWGREEATGDPLERAAKNLFNPAYVSQVEVDNVERELQRLADATGEVGIFPKRAEKSISVGDGKEKNFTAEEYVAYAKDLGQTSYKLVQAGMNTAAYRSMSNSAKVEYLNDLHSYASAVARAKAGGKALEGWQLNARNAQKDLGVSTAEYIALYQKYGSKILSGNGYAKTKDAVKAGLTVEQYAHMKANVDADGNGSVSQAEAKSYLDTQDYTRGQKADLFQLMNSSWKKNPYA